MAPANWRDATCRDASLCAQKLPQAIDFNGCLRHYETIWKCEMVPGASSQSPHNSLLYNEKSSVWKTLRPTGRPTADVLLKTAPLVASSENLISAAAWTSDRDWPQADRPLYARMGKSRLCPARACGRLFYINRAGDRSAHLPSAQRIDEPIDLLVNLAGSLTKQIANVARRLHEGVVVGKSEVSAFTYSQLVRAFPP